MSAEHSRAMKLAEGVSTKKVSALERHMESSVVAISVDAEMPHAELTALTLVTTLRRGPGRLLLLGAGLPPVLITHVQDAARSIDPDRGLGVIGIRGEVPDGAIRIHIGPTAPDRAIRLVPEGYGAHIAGSRTAVIRPRRPPNPIGAIYTAALGAAEAFKYTASVIPDRRVLHRHLTFSPLALSRDLSLAPDLGSLEGLDLTLAGVGAIGTGIVLLLEAVGASGRILLIDRQRFAKENLGTYSIGAKADIASAPWKVDLATPHLRRFDVVAQHIPVVDAIQLVDSGQLPWSPIVLAAFDSPDARREVQRLWPDRLIDAQTGDTMLGIYDHRHGIDPCMFCVFPVDRRAPSGADIVAERLGLPVEEMVRPDAVLTEAHLEGKSAEQQALLRPHIGQLMCGLAQATGLSALRADEFMPSVPFVSLQAACLSVSRLVAVKQGLMPGGANLVQYDGLFGPQAATIEMMRRRPRCLCETRQSSIERTRDHRRKQAATAVPRHEKPPT